MQPIRNNILRVRVQIQFSEANLYGIQHFIIQLNSPSAALTE